MNETAVRALVLQTFRPHGRVHEEVWLRHLNGADLRVDFLVEAETLGAECEKLALFGVEAKGRTDGMDDDNAGLAQCIEYMHCAVVDTRFPWLTGKSMSSVVLFSPNTLECEGPTNSRHWYYTTRVAAKFGVGVVTCPYRGGMTIEMPLGHNLWSDKRGVSAAGRTWCKPARVGARIK